MNWNLKKMASNNRRSGKDENKEMRNSITIWE
jgi:hypothetical protein